MTRWALLVAAIASEVTGSLALKGALDQRAWYVVAAVGYVTSFVLLLAVLRRGMPLGVAYGIWGALGVAATAVMSAILFHESVTGLMGVGLGLVIAGVLVVELGHQAATSRQRPEGAR
jgi:small multidrug resistance pump